MNVVMAGHSGTGKDSLSKMLTENFKYERVVPTTTRPKREYEVDGVDYHFVTDEQFANMNENNKFFSVATYNGWCYGIEYSEFKKDNWVAVVNDADLQKLVYERDIMKSMDFVSILITADEEERIKRQIIRGDDKDEIVARLVRDDNKWESMEYMFDYSIPNNGEEWDAVINILKAILDYKE